MTVTLRQIAGHINASFNTVRSRAAREYWPTCGTTVINHNETKLYAIDALPSDIQETVWGQT